MKKSNFDSGGNDTELIASTECNLPRIRKNGVRHDNPRTAKTIRERRTSL